MPKLEKAIVNEVMALLKAVPASFSYKFHGTAFATAGMPDILFFCRGVAQHAFPVVVFFEAKRPGERQTPLQLHIAEKIQRAGVPVRVVHSKEEAADVLRGLGAIE